MGDSLGAAPALAGAPRFPSNKSTVGHLHPDDPGCAHFASCTRGTLPLRPTESAASSVRVLCAIMCLKRRRRSCEVQRRTWGMACDKVIFIADFDDGALGAVDVHGRWEGKAAYASRDKMSRGWLHIANHFIDDYDWFFKADDDSIVLVDNFRRYVVETAHLYGHRPHEPRYVGLRQMQGGGPTRQFNLGAGFALNRPAMRLVSCMLTSNISTTAPTKVGGKMNALERCLIVPPNFVRGVEPVYATVKPLRFKRRGCIKGFADPYDCTCDFWKQQRNEDLNMAVCLKYWGVLPEDTRDDKLRERFFSTAPWWVYAHTARYNHGFQGYAHPSSTHACGCLRVARHPVLFHSLKAPQSMLRASCGLLGEEALGHEPLCRSYFDEPLDYLLSKAQGHEFGYQSTKWDGVWTPAI